jgi:hypothetical protein
MGSRTPLTDEEILKILEQENLDIELAAIKAVAKIESLRYGFINSRPVILFEGHWFSKYTHKIYDSTHPTISYPSWTKKYYGKSQDEEWQRFKTAEALNPRAARLSTSWGKFQIMGFNYSEAGFTTLDAFVAAMHKNEVEHLKAFLSILRSFGLVTVLKEKNWEIFARRYNGPGYKANAYDTKLAKAYEDYSDKGIQTA